jgi:DNA-binding transcriptional LysR family regulator
MESISRMVLFAKLVEAKSFSSAAKQLDVSASLVSKQINGLEQSLGVRLLNRTTRALSLTEAGAVFYKHCAEMLAIADRAQAHLSDLQGGPRGTLKVTGATTFGLLHIAPALPAFLLRYPDISIDVTFYDRVVDIAAEGYDVAIRIGDPVHPGLVARRLATLRWVVCASPEYFARQGKPLVPTDLQQRNCLFYSHGDGYAQNHVVFRRSDTETPVTLTGNYRINNSAALCHAAIQGLGIAIVPSFAVGDSVRTGLLEFALEDYALPTRELNALYFPDARTPLKIRTFVDYLAERFSSIPYWD